MRVGQGQATLPSLGSGEVKQREVYTKKLIFLYNLECECVSVIGCGETNVSLCVVHGGVSNQ